MVEALLRQNEGWLGPLERPALAWLAPRMPVWINPDRLSAIGMAGALICLIGYAWAAVNPAGLWLASVGLAVNWFGALCCRVTSVAGSVSTELVCVVDGDSWY